MGATDHRSRAWPAPTGIPRTGTTVATIDRHCPQVRSQSRSHRQRGKPTNLRTPRRCGGGANSAAQPAGRPRDHIRRMSCAIAPYMS